MKSWRWSQQPDRELNGIFARAGRDEAKVPDCAGRRGFGGTISFERSEYEIVEEKNSQQPDKIKSIFF